MALYLHSTRAIRSAQQPGPRTFSMRLGIGSPLFLSRPLKSGRSVPLWLSTLILLFGPQAPSCSQRPPEPVDISPIDGETYYCINQLSGLQMDLNRSEEHTSELQSRQYLVC